jgi:CBS domain-containing protein
MYTIKEIMKTDIISFAISTPIVEALQLLINNKISGAPVIDANKKIIGIISEADLLLLFWNIGAKTVGDIMTKEIYSFSQDDDLELVLDCLMTYNFKRVLIHDGNNILVGLISRSDIMPLLLSSLDEIMNN